MLAGNRPRLSSGPATPCGTAKRRSTSHPRTLKGPGGFELTAGTVAGLRAKLDTDGRLDVTVLIEIHDAAGTLVAEASKVIYARRTDHLSTDR